MRVQQTSAALLALAAAGAEAATLHELAVKAGKMYYGTATDNGSFNDAPYVEILRSEFGQLTPSNGQKWESTEPQRGVFSFSNGDVVANFAAENKQLLRCHTLVWHSQLPSWVSSGSWTQETLTAVIESHIANVVEHYKGKCYAWDVVNEALNEDGTWRDSVFSRVFPGGSFIPLAFKATAKADPATKLYYNDYNIEKLGAKQAATANIVKQIIAAGGKIDGVGMQAHLIVGSMPTLDSMVGTMNSYVAAGASEVAYTELDIRHRTLPANETAVQQQATDYASITQACLNVKECIGITIWDFADKYSWIPGVFPGQGAALLWDDNLQKKPAYYSVSSVLAAAATTPAPPASSSSSATAVPPVSSSTTTEDEATPTDACTPHPVTTESSTTSEPAPVTTPSSTLVTKTSSTTSSTSSAPAEPTGCTARKWDQCGGRDFKGCKTCVAGTTCKEQNPWYSQCL